MTGVTHFSISASLMWMNRFILTFWMQLGMNHDSFCFHEVRDMKEGSKTWIAKPSLTNQGHSICIFDRVSMLAAAVEEADEMREWVIQEYIHPPLLVHGRKFHLRVYALCIGSLRAYIYSDILMLLAGRLPACQSWSHPATMCAFMSGCCLTGTPYDLSLNNLADLGSHLTNTCRQSEGQDSSLFDEDAVVKLLSDLPKVQFRAQL